MTPFFVTGIAEVTRRRNTFSGSPVWAFEIPPYRPFLTDPDAAFAAGITPDLNGQRLTIEIRRGKVVDYHLH